MLPGCTPTLSSRDRSSFLPIPLAVHIIGFVFMGAQDRVIELNLAAARLARMAADAAKAHVMVAGSSGPTGELFAPMGALDYADARTAFTEQALALFEGGADMLWVETMSSLEESGRPSMPRRQPVFRLPPA